MSYWVYVHTCKANGKRYVGITTASRPELRWKEGRGYENQLFGKAVRKHGWNNFQHEAWELTCESEMYYAEKYLIAYYHTTENEFGYNHSSGGECRHLGCKHSEESKKKMSEAHKKIWLDPGYRKKFSEVRKGKSLGEEHRKHCIEAAKKKAKNPEYLKKLSEAKKGKPLPRITIKLPDGTVIEVTKQVLTRWYINKGRASAYAP